MKLLFFVCLFLLFVSSRALKCYSCESLKGENSQCNTVDNQTPIKDNCERCWQSIETDQTVRRQCLNVYILDVVFNTGFQLGFSTFSCNKDFCNRFSKPPSHTSTTEITTVTTETSGAALKEAGKIGFAFFVILGSINLFK
ncbi:hypothetical protein M3Y97_01079200 [Aphelenchoides bicaudatus]|nr:hypothetical protein M3Y97_01079200 [Aphelenchoides bicaudatus]